jgi:hypothetical protein
MAGTALDDRVSRPTACAKFILGAPEHDPDIRRLLRNNPMPGAISISLEREPEYFRGANIGGAHDETILVFEKDRLSCMGRCSFRDRWINGRSRRTGYLGELRLDAPAQGRFDLLRRGYRYFHELHRDEAAECYFTSIAADNDRARRLLESGRKGLPVYTFFAGFVTALIAVPRRPRAGSLRVEAGTPARAAEIVSMLNDHARRHQLAATWTTESLLSLARHGLPIERFHLVMDGGRCVACGALWDQRNFRQTVIRGYAPSLAVSRPFINLSARLRGTPRLPPVGATLGLGFVSPLAFESGCESLLSDFIESLFPSAAQAGLEFLTLGLPARDSRLPALQRRFSTRLYHSRLYEVSWFDASAILHSDETSFQPEVALL